MRRNLLDGFLSVPCCVWYAAFSAVVHSYRSRSCAPCWE